MTMKRYINLLLAFCVSALTLQSCFQDMDHPAFDYPDSSAPKVFSPMKLFLPFENDMRDKGNYTFLMSAGGDITYTDGINGQAYQGTKDTYLLARVPSYLADSIPDLGSCTVAFWMKQREILPHMVSSVFLIPRLSGVILISIWKIQVVRPRLSSRCICITVHQ